MKGLVYEGDPTDPDGYVMTATATWIENGKRAARVGDLVCCGLHGLHPIVEGDASMMWEGESLVVHGGRVACGCRVLSTQSSALIG
jgi:uncharacterized Zn-binding protein involved in type VI secretion